MKSLKGIKQVSVLNDQTATEAAKHLAGLGAEIELVDIPPRVPDYRAGKKQLYIGDKRGEVMHRCASLSEEYLCCNVHVLSSVSNCPYECSYCFLQNYLTDSTLSVVGDVEAMLNEVREKVGAQPDRLFRIGTWELGDSLALEELVGTAAQLVRGFAQIPNALLELKTKSALVTPLLDLPHAGRTVVSWTMNPQPVIDQEEYATASAEERIHAMAEVASAGYPVAIHFDPMIWYPEWEQGYRDLVRAIFSEVPASRIAWISMGSLRFNPEMKRVMESNYPRSRATCAEMVLGNDGKMRYVKPLRLEMYRALNQALRDFGGERLMTYLCMERWDVWDRILGWRPDSIEHLDFLMADSLYRQFPGLFMQRPRTEDYGIGA